MLWGHWPSKKSVPKLKLQNVESKSGERGYSQRKTGLGFCGSHSALLHQLRASLSCRLCCQFVIRSFCLSCELWLFMCTQARQRYFLTEFYGLMIEPAFVMCRLAGLRKEAGHQWIIRTDCVNIYCIHNLCICGINWHGCGCESGLYPAVFQQSIFLRFPFTKALAG